MSRSMLATVMAIIAGLLIAASAGPARAQGQATGQFMSEAVVRVTNVANGAKFNKYGYNEGISILGGWVNEKAGLTFTTPLAAGVDYLFLAGGDNDALDVDLEILDARNNVLAADLGIAPNASVTFTPRSPATTP